MYRDGLYLLGRKQSESFLRSFALERFDGAEVDRTASFELPDGFEPASYLRGRLGIWEPEGNPVRVEIAFSPGAGELAAYRTWPGFRKWRKARDGRHVLVMDLPLSAEVVTWAVSWGPQAEVLRPKSLRDAVVAELRGALEQYGECRPSR